MEGNSVDLSRELKTLRNDLINQFQSQSWSELSETLETLVRVGEHQGQLELCLRAQSLHELMGNRANGRESSGQRLNELFHELMFHLSHLQWSNQTSH